MRYLMMIFGDPAIEAQATPEELEADFARYGQYTQDMQSRGVLRGGEALEPPSVATTIRLRDGQILKTDGPFAETKEQLGGYYVLECKDLDEAIELAALIPGAAYGSIEIRPIMELGG